MTAINIDLGDDGRRAIIKPASYLASAFYDFKAACDRGGASYDGTLRTQTASLDSVPGIVELLREAGFEPRLSASVVSGLRGRQSELEVRVGNARARLSVLANAFAKRNLALMNFQVEGTTWLATRTSALLGDEQGLGKFLSDDTKVLTPTGWRRNGDLRVGDFVIGSCGKRTRVTGVFHQPGSQKLYRVHFSDGSSVEAGGPHLWTVRYRRGGKRMVDLTLTTDQLRERPAVDAGGRKLLELRGVDLYLPMLTGPVQFKNHAHPLPVPAYAVGVLIANGGLTCGNARCTINENDAEEVLENLRASGVDTSTPASKPGCTAFNLYETIGAIRGLGLCVRSRKKFIPKRYKLASVEDRIALLHGLMDCDGSISRTRNRLTYHTTSQRLANDVVELVECLGGIASTRDYDRSHEGKPTEYHVRIRLPQWVTPFTVSRKASRYNPTNRSLPCRTVKSVEYVGTRKATCIKVAASDQLYVTEHAILTHNTIQVLAALEPGVPMLCVAPANVVENWPLESVKWRPEFSVAVLNKKSFRWPAKGEIVVVSHDALPAGIEQERTSQMQPKVFRQDASIGAPLPGTVVVIDEIQKGANHRTKRYAAFSAAVEEVHAVGGTSWGLSGTPLRNHPGELWNVLSILKIAREAFGSRKRFDELHDVSFGTYGGREFGTAIRSDAVAEGLRRVMLRREKKDQIDLPPVIYQKLTVSIDQATMRLCDEVAKKIGMSDDALERAIEDAIESKHGASFTELSRARAALASAKIPAMLEFVETAEENEEPLIVFSYHRAPIDALAKRPGWARISGDETPIQRRDVVAQFQAGKLKGVALTIGAGAEGITLTRGRVMLFVDLAWTPASNNQARDRFNRIGQLADRLTVYNLVAKHRVDERVSEILNAKSFITNETVNAATVVSIDVSNTALRIERVLNDASNVVTSDDELANREIDGVQIAPVTPSEALAADWLRSGVYGSKLNQAELGYATMLGARLTKGLGLTTTQWTAASVLHARSAS